jgi:hypothetical protein
MNKLEGNSLGCKKEVLKKIMKNVSISAVQQRLPTLIYIGL